MGHCNIHNQNYMEHVNECPICLGEKMTTIPTREIIEAEPKRFKRKRKVVQIDADELNSDWIKNNAK